MREMVLVVDKAVGPTSFDVVRQMKRLLPRGEKIGHGGSLDPFASGVLILLVGRATKLSGALLNADKVYRASIRLGKSTDTMDRMGKVTREEPVPPVTEQEVQSLLSNMEGNWDQVPPMYSAKKHKGVRLYTLARKNLEVVREPVTVRLHRLTLIELKGDLVEIEVHCSKGTYVRSLADEIGRRLGTVAYLENLRRTECGIFKLEEAVCVEDLEKDPKTWFPRGFENFVRLVRKETLVRRQSRAGESLPMPLNDGNSLLN